MSDATGLHPNTVKHLEWLAERCVGDFCDRYNDLKYVRWREQLGEIFLARVTMPEDVLSFVDLCSHNMTDRQVLAAVRRKEDLRKQERKHVA